MLLSIHWTGVTRGTAAAAALLEDFLPATRQTKQGDHAIHVYIWTPHTIHTPHIIHTAHNTHCTHYTSHCPSQAESV